MKKNEKPATSSVSPTRTDHGAKPAAKNAPSPSANDLGQGVDRPGFDMGGSSGDTQAGTGLGLGEDAFETPGDQRLPGRRLHNHLTIPRWSGSEPRETATSGKKTTDTQEPSSPKTKKAR